MKKKSMANLSYWEYKHYFKDLDFCVVGMGIVGVHCAYFLRKKHPNAKIIILDQSPIGAAASSKNAGFACFGSLSEINEDIKSMGLNKTLDLVNMRYEGLQLLRKIHGDEALGFKKSGGFELFRPQDQESLEACLDIMPLMNTELSYIQNQTYSYDPSQNPFRGVKALIANNAEGEIGTHLLLKSLEKIIHDSNIISMRGVSLDTFIETGNGLELKTTVGDFRCSGLFLANNGFAKKLIPELTVEPARAQVILTSPLRTLDLKGCYHYDAGYYYFRMIDQRLLIGGGRNLDFEAERTYSQENTPLITTAIKKLIDEVITEEEYQIAYTWAGTMGIGPERWPIIEKYGENAVLGVRMGGMGIAIGALVGKKMADLL